MRPFSARLDSPSSRMSAPAETDPGLLALLNRFWFHPADPTSLGLIRVCSGLVILYLHLVYAGGLQTYFGKNGWLDVGTANEMRINFPVPPPRSESQIADPLIEVRNKAYTDADREDYKRKWSGVDPANLVHRGYYIWSLWFHITDPAWMAVITAGMLLAMVLFTLGVGTRITSVLTWVSALCFIHRNNTILYGLDSILAVLLFYLMIGPSGAALSVDRWLARWWKARRTGQKTGSLLDSAPPAPSVGANFTMRLMQIHFCIIYFASGTSKLQGPAWWSGTALWNVVANPEFAPMHLAVYRAWVQFLADHLWIRETLLASMDAGTLVLELSLPFLIWIRRWRPYMIGGAVLLHTGIGVIMGLTTFGLCMLCLLLAFVPGEAVRRGLRLSMDWLRGEDLKTGVRPVLATGELTLQRH